jgi:Mannose-6-phosphate isomerase C-terminal
VGVTHRLENPGRLPLEIIEVQSGAYLGEDDIVRYDDAYGRVAAEPASDAKPLLALATDATRAARADGAQAAGT